MFPLATVIAAYVLTPLYTAFTNSNLIILTTFSSKYSWISARQRENYIASGSCMDEKKHANKEEK